MGFRRWLRFPELFIDELRQFPSCELRLREASGEQAIWAMESWANNPGTHYLGKAWTYFADHYELQVGYILKFRYRGKGHLSVKIFDDTFCRRSFYLPLEEGLVPEDP